MSRTYETLSIERKGQVATILLGRIDNYGDQPPPSCAAYICLRNWRTRSTSCVATSPFA